MPAATSRTCSRSRTPWPRRAPTPPGWRTDSWCWPTNATRTAAPRPWGRPNRPRWTRTGSSSACASTRTAPGVSSCTSSRRCSGRAGFMTMFGRDSIFTSLQALPFTPELATTTLRVLGDWQGSRTDDFRDEDPGRILHEMRYGELTAFQERPHSPYYGNADATPLYVVLMDEYERWPGDAGLVREFEQEARAALRWIDDY